MKHFARCLVVCCLLVVFRPAAVFAQAFPTFDQQWSDLVKHEGDHYWATGAVELWKGDTRFYADEADYYADTHRLIARGNVTVIQQDSSISAQSIDFNTETDRGIFYNGWGMASLGNRVDRSMFGTLEPDMYFYGETIEKIGERKYRITRGGFTTCVQPVPRWQLTSGSVVISLEHYAVLTNPVLRVKGVPLFYLPILYYPVKTKEDRATGFLLPIYGTSSAHGFSLSNQFFWAINRSQDVSVMHDWFSKTGQGVGEEYRYVRKPGSTGSVLFYMLNEHEYTTADAAGTTTTIPAKRSYKIRASADETVNRYLRATATVQYFTDVVSQQTYNMNIYDASRSSRTIRAAASGAWHGYSYAGQFTRQETFAGADTSALQAAEPRLTLTRGERPIGDLPIYFTFGGEYARLRHGSTTAATTDTPAAEVSNSLSRVDVSPTVRVPFTKISFLAVNNSVSWRGTYWSKSWLVVDPNDQSKNVFLQEPVSRRFFDFTSNIVGPTVARIFTPDNDYAEKIKHTIEPSVTLNYTTAVPEFDRIIQWEAVDTIVGGTTRIAYGLSNRLYAKRKHEGKVLPAREILSVGIGQTYYSNERASQFDPSYATSFTAAKPNHFSPIALTARGVPADGLNATFRAEFDSRSLVLRTVAANGNYSAGTWLNTSAGWSLTRSVTATGLVNAGQAAQFLNGAANIRLRQNKYGGNYSFNYDFAQGSFVQQRITGYYNAQCCGFAVEYQTFNFGNLPGVPVPQDHRLNFSVTLAGIGSFSNFFGAMNGAPR